MSKWSKAASSVVGRGLTTGREKITMDELIKTYPNGVSVTGFDFVTYKDSHRESTFPVFTYAEDAGRYFAGGKALTQIAQAWVELSEGDLTAANRELKLEPCRIKLRKVRTNKGNMFVAVEVIDEE